MTKAELSKERTEQARSVTWIARSCPALSDILFVRSKKRNPRLIPEDAIRHLIVVTKLFASLKVGGSSVRENA